MSHYEGRLVLRLFAWVRVFRVLVHQKLITGSCVLVERSLLYLRFRPLIGLPDPRTVVNVPKVKVSFRDLKYLISNVYRSQVVFGFEVTVDSFYQFTMIFRIHICHTLPIRFQHFSHSHTPLVFDTFLDAQQLLHFWCSKPPSLFGRLITNFDFVVVIVINCTSLSLPITNCR